MCSLSAFIFLFILWVLAQRRLGPLPPHASKPSLIRAQILGDQANRGSAIDSTGRSKQHGPTLTFNSSILIELNPKSIRNRSTPEPKPPKRRRTSCTAAMQTPPNHTFGTDFSAHRALAQKPSDQLIFDQINYRIYPRASRSSQPAARNRSNSQNERVFFFFKCERRSDESERARAIRGRYAGKPWRAALCPLPMRRSTAALDARPPTARGGAGGSTSGSQTFNPARLSGSKC